MSRKSKTVREAALQNSYEAPAICHDHFDGSAHCIECGGWCKLSGTEMAYTALVRILFEGESWGYPIAHRTLSQLKSSGVDVIAFRKRASECPFGKNDGGAQ